MRIRESIFGDFEVLDCRASLRSPTQASLRQRRGIKQLLNTSLCGGQVWVSPVQVNQASLDHLCKTCLKALGKQGHPADRRLCLLLQRVGHFCSGGVSPSHGRDSRRVSQEGRKVRGRPRGEAPRPAGAPGRGTCKTAGKKRERWMGKRWRSPLLPSEFPLLPQTRSLLERITSRSSPTSLLSLLLPPLDTQPFLCS